MKTFKKSPVIPIWDFSNLEDNLDSLKAAVWRLKSKKGNIKIRVKQEESPYKQSTYKVTDWLYRANRLETEADIVIAKGEEALKKRGPGGCCCLVNCLSSDVGKQVCEMLNAVTKIMSEGEFDVVVERRPHDSADVIHVKSTVAFGSELEDVWRCIYDDSFRIIGIYGMAGVGKSTLLKKIQDELIERQDYSGMVIWVTVSKEGGVDAVQNVIRNCLGITDQTWKNTEDKARLLGSRKFILLLDDLWDRLDLLKFGVSLTEGNESKVVFTTRLEGVCDDMKTQVKLELNCMSSEEAMKLFWMKVGENTRNSVAQMENVAETINEKVCQGLPLALDAVGQAMCGMRNSEWKHVKSIMEDDPSRLPGMNHIFRVLEPSYNNLEDSAIKDCFLYTCILPDVVGKDELIKLWIGEGFLDMDDDNLGEYIIKRLSLSCLLLLDRSVPRDVRMHGVIRTFGLWLACEHGIRQNKILFQERRIEKWVEASRISIMYGDIDVEPPMNPCPKLQTLLIRYTNLCVLPSRFSNSMNALGVLDLSGNRSLVGLPSSVGSLINLHYLNLSSTCIKELPIEVKNLINLKLLLVDYTERFQVISKGVLSSVPSLQVFSKLGNETFDDMTFLEELECNECISYISISLFSHLAAEKMLNSQKLQNCIRNLSFRNIKSLNVPISVLSRMVQLQELAIEDCEHLKFVTDNFQYYVLNIQALEIRCCSTIDSLEWLIFAPRLRTLHLLNCKSLLQVLGNDFKSEEIKEIDERLGIFSNLKKLYLANLPCLRCISPQVLQFPVLERIVVIECPKLFKLPFNLHNAKRLKEIEGSRSWWDDVQWEDRAIRDVLDSKFQVLHEAVSDPPQHCLHSESTTSDIEEKTPSIEKEWTPFNIGEKWTPSNIEGKSVTPGKERKLVLEPPVGSQKFVSIWPKPFTYKELVKASGGFSTANILGMGGFGRVYKGILPNGEVVAIKRFESKNTTEFWTEMETIGRIHHRHIVKLIGYCNHKDNNLLLYEFLSNNSLGSHLHGKTESTIPWSSRMRIALGTAKGLAYLHDGCDPRIIHRDIKPSNILLNNDFEPKIAGFGIAVVFPDYNMDEIHSDSIAGTLGYIDPEYFSTMIVSDKVDVFSFGIVLLELITGNPAVMRQSSDNLIFWVRRRLENALKTGNYDILVDPLLEDYDEKEMVRMIYCAAACVYKPRNLRPKMGQIVEVLQGFVPEEFIWQKKDSTFLHGVSQYHIADADEIEVEEDIK